ncbi:hypothetical protein PV396_44530 [Streptomyces sp. ME02-8801-2C]|uniref:Rv1733c family protein n=1 Tax=Streptomyces sp. ME02-8801-2C TaxID=3028680 RepID=UPI0029B45A19|nr:hypothetical protein [Streptomyces sp. ME02-8801-2C]MDX3458912.1 hypothetical protein [Streptomyces sp. ME02-8801-2C]
MRGAKRMRKWLWRWRSNPLRRRDDIVEAWIVLAVWSVIALGGTLVGTVTARAADDSFAQLRAERHVVRAVLVESTTGAVPTTEGVRDGRVRAKVRWTASDGSPHTGRALVNFGRKAGSPVVVWTDDAGRLASQPPTTAQASAQAGVMGVSAALALAGLVYAAGRVTRWRLDSRRFEAWDREWDRVEPQWRRKAT